MGWGGGVLPYISHLGMCRPKGPFWSETGIDFAHFGLELGMDFEKFPGEPPGL